MEIVSVSLETVVVVSRDQVSCDLQGEVAVLNLRNGVYYGLDPVGARVWSLVQKPTKVQDLLSVMLDEYDVDAPRCEKDLVALLTDLAEQGLIDVQ